MSVYRKYGTGGCVEKQIQHEAKLSAVFVLIKTPLSAVFSVPMSVSGALTGIYVAFCSRLSLV